MQRTIVGLLNLLLIAGLIYLVYLLFSSLIVIKNEVVSINHKLDQILPQVYETAKTIEGTVENIEEKTDESTLLKI